MYYLCTPRSKTFFVFISLAEYTSNGLEIYYDEITRQPVGVIWDDFVILKDCSTKKVNWYDAIGYCANIAINGIVAQLPPAWLFENDTLCKALEEIGAENLGMAIWNAYGHDYRNAGIVILSVYDSVVHKKKPWRVYQSYSKYRSKFFGKCFVRPVLRIKRTNCRYLF